MFKKLKNNYNNNTFILIPVILNCALGLFVFLDIYISYDIISGYITYLILFIWCLFFTPFFFINLKK